MRRKRGETERGGGREAGKQAGMDAGIDSCNDSEQTISSYQEENRVFFVNSSL